MLRAGIKRSEALLTFTEALGEEVKEGLRTLADVT